MGYKTITQIVMTIIALIIIFTYIQPKLIAIRQTQDELFQYVDTSDKAVELNDTLSELSGIEQSFRTSDKVALNNYLPSTIDNMAVMADIETMASRSNIRIVDMSAGEIKLPPEDSLLDGELVKTRKTSNVDFKLQFTGSYESLKSFLQLLEKNKYPLEIVNISFGESADKEIEVVNQGVSLDGNYEMTLRTYAYSYLDN